MPEVDREEIQAQLERIFAAKTFARAQRLQQFLRFVLSKYLAGEAAELKETSIGLDVFNRPDYDPAKDTIVRTTATRVRQKLVAYYEAEGQSDPWIIELPPDTYVPRILPREVPAETLAESASSSHYALFFRRPWTLFAILVGVPLLAVLLTRQTPDRNSMTVSYRQLTDDGIPKGDPLFTDGVEVYFEWYIHRRWVPAAVAVGGGNAVRMPVPFTSPQLLDMHPGPRFLIAAPEANGKMSLWEWTREAEPHLLGPTSEGSAIWGKAEDIIEPLNSIGQLHWRRSGQRLKLPGVIHTPRWSEARSSLRVTLSDRVKETNVMWEVRPSTGSAEPVYGLPPDSYGGNWTPDGRQFVFLAFRDGSPPWQPESDIWLLREDIPQPGRRAEPVRLTHGPLNFRSAVLSPDGRRIFALGSTTHGELVRFDRRANQFIPLIEHLWAVQTDFSREGDWIAYVRYPDRTLWKMRADGSQRTQLTFPPLGVHEPHWSPDGAQIAFMGQLSRERYRVYTVPSSGGSPTELAASDDHDQGVPTWSPDGRQVMFGDLLFRKPAGDMSIRIFNLDHHSLEELPGSKGIWTPRWSPDGEFVLGLSPDFQKLLLYNCQTRVWRELVRLEFIDHPSWSADSSSIYFMGRKSSDLDRAYYRYFLRTGAMERVIDLNSFEEASFEWFGVTPDGTPLAARSAQVNEIYSIQLRN